MANEHELRISFIADIAGFSNSMNELRESLNRMRNDLDDVMQNAQQSTTNATSKISSAMMGLGGIAVGAFAAMGSAMIAGVMSTDNYQKALNGLQAATGTTSAEMDGMGESMKNIYANNLGESFDDIAQSMATVNQSMGLTGAELENTTKNALRLRDTFEMDVTESTNAANSMMKQFGISSEEAFNLIAQGAQNGANKNGD